MLFTQEIESHVVRLGGVAPPTPAPAAAEAGTSSSVGNAAATDGAGPSTSAAPAGAAAGSKQGQAPTQAEGTKEGVVELGGDKRCTVSEFKGAKHVDLREWYRKVRVCG